MAAESLIGGFVLLIVLLWLAIIVIGILAFIFWILMLIDCAKRNFKKDNDKIIWVLIIIFTGIIGAIIYYFVIKKRKGKT